MTEAVKTNEWLPRISEEEGMDGQSPEILRAVKLRCETLHLSRPAGGSAPGAEPGLSGALGVTEPTQQGSAAVTRVPLGRGVLGTGGCACLGAAGTRELSVRFRSISL